MAFALVREILGLGRRTMGGGLGRTTGGEAGRKFGGSMGCDTLGQALGKVHSELRVAVPGL